LKKKFFDLIVAHNTLEEVSKEEGVSFVALENRPLDGILFIWNIIFFINRYGSIE
jgi:hypothetical protein